MKRSLITFALTTAALLLGSHLAFAAGTQAAAPQASASKASPNSAKDKTPTRSKLVAKGKLVDINGASSAELKKLPGVSDATAAKIIAGRPYATKAHLVTRNIVDTGTYEGVRNLVIAKQPNKDAAKNAALYSKKK